MRFYHLASIPVLTAAFASTAGCERGPAASVAPPPPLRSGLAHTDPAVGFGGDESDRTYDFGPVVGGRGGKLPHNYVLTNTLDRNVRVLEFTNAKPCCGEVDPIEPTTLAPGESITLKVRIKAGETLGPLSHRALLKTDLTESEEFEFWTLADIVPRVRIEETTRKVTALFPGQSARREFTAVSSGTKDDPPLVLDDDTVKASTGLRWGSPAKESRSEGRIAESRRPFTIELKADGLPGSRQTVLLIMDGTNVLLRHILAWEVASSLKASPPGLIITEGSGQVEKSVLIRSMDKREFSLSEATSSLPGVAAEFQSGERRGSHILRVKIAPGPGNRGKTGQVTVTTDHPNQRVVTISLFVSNAS